MKTKTLLALIAIAELATGLGLLVAPSIVVELLLGQPLGPGIPFVVARVAGIALIAIGLVCWLENTSDRAGAPVNLLIGLLVYNVAIPALLVHGFMTRVANGIGLWPVVVLHLAFAAWLAACLRFHLGPRAR